MASESRLKDLHPSTTTYQQIGDANVAWHDGDAEAEYRSLRGTYGVIDHSGLGLIAIMGDASDLLGEVLARDVQYLTPEQCTTSLMLGDDGTPIDIVTVYGLEDGAIVETSVGRGQSTYEHLQGHAGEDFEIAVLSDERSVIGIEGPYAWGLVGRLIDPEFTAMPYESTLMTEWRGADILFARNGFTGEYGYKVIAAHEVIRDFWSAAIADAPPVGQQALETAMIEVRQPVFHRELRPGTNLLTCGWNWLVDVSKPEYVGRDALQGLIDVGTQVSTVGFRASGAEQPMAGATVYAAEVPVGEVVHAVWSPAIDEWVGLACLQSELAAAGLDLSVSGTDDRLPITTTSSPYVIPASWSVPIF